MWFRRLVRPKSLAVFGLLFVLLATGTRWLLLVIPEGYLAELSSQVQLTGSALTSGPELFRALVSPWIIEGGSPIPFPFAFSNGIIPPVILAMTGYGALPYLTAVTLLMLLRRNNSASQKFFLGLMLSSLAITGEHLFLMVWTGILLAYTFTLAGHSPNPQYLSRSNSLGLVLTSQPDHRFIGRGRAD